MKTVIRDTFDLSADTFWERVFFDREYQLRMYREALGCSYVEILEASGEGEASGPRTRRLVFQQPVNAPAAVQKLFGNAMRMEERGHFDPVRQRWHFQMIPDQMPDRLKIAGETWLEPAGPGQIQRVCEMDFSVSVFGVGGLIERFMVSATAESYEKQARFIRAFIREKALF
jgi:hypothetical protein